MTLVPTLTLNNGIDIPQLGFGTAGVRSVETLVSALSVGYRHLDTAEGYRNATEIRRALEESDVERSDVFVTSKLGVDRISVDEIRESFDQTLANLGMDCIDMFLIHWPLPTRRDFVETWRVLEAFSAEGRTRAIGVSNFQIAHLRRLFEETSIVPAVNQIEVHPYLTQTELLDFNSQHGIATEAWSPIAKGAVIKDQTVTRIASEYQKTPAQIVLRWHIQLGNILFPKSNDPARMRENFEIFNFQLSAADMSRISALNRNERLGDDPDTFAFLPSRNAR